MHVRGDKEASCVQKKPTCFPLEAFMRRLEKRPSAAVTSRGVFSAHEKQGKINGKSFKSSITGRRLPETRGLIGVFALA